MLQHGVQHMSQPKQAAPEHNFFHTPQARLRLGGLCSWPHQPVCNWHWAHQPPCCQQLGFLYTTIEPKTYLTPAKEFQCCKEVTITEISLPEIMLSKYFTAMLRVMDLQYMPYNMLLKQDM